jgi:hypothetical protein
MLRACPKQSKIQAGLASRGCVSLTVDFAASRERNLCEEGISRGDGRDLRFFEATFFRAESVILG